MEVNKIYNGDSAKLMKEIPDNFIDLTVTSPPYDNLRDYKGYLFDFETIAKELYRVTKEGGVVVWVVGDQTIDGSETGTSFRQALYFMSIGFNLHDTMIYSKAGFQYPSLDRYHQTFEYMFVLSKGKPKKINLLKDKKNNYDRRGGDIKRQKDGTMKRGNNSGLPLEEYGQRYNIWYYKIGDGNVTKDNFAYKHPAMFPEQLAKDHILSWSNEKDLVFDPFAGSGTTLKMAKLMNRNYLGFEIAEEYIPIINKRLGQETILAFCPEGTHKTKIEVNKIYNKNCIESLKELPDQCVDLIVTSPPYNAGIKYDVYNDKVSQEEYLKMLEESGKEFFRVLKSDGRICINVGIVSKNNETEDYFFIPYEIYNIYMKIGFIPREVIHWIKGKDENTFYRGNTAWGSWKSASNPHLRSLSEDILVFNKKYWGKQKQGESDLTTNEFKWWTKSVWFIVADCETHEKGHPAVFPEELTKRLIKLYSYVGDVVLDPFCGIGTTCIVSKHFKRKYIGYDLSPQYCKIAIERCNQEILCFPETLPSANH